MKIRFKFHARKNCPECEGDGFIVTGTRAGFNPWTFEITDEDDGHYCSLCLEKSQKDYEYAQEQKFQEMRDER
jgi:RecJ-like exonuclease